MTDVRGRLKPSYYALRRAWTGRTFTAGPTIKSLVASARAGVPGSEITLRADVVDDVGDGRTESPSYHWSVVGPDYEPDAGTIRPTDRAGEVRLRLPRRAGRYRVVLQVRGEHGLDERSYPILVRRLPLMPEATFVAAPHGHGEWPGRSMARLRVLEGG